VLAGVDQVGTAVRDSLLQGRARSRVAAKRAGAATRRYRPWRARPLDRHGGPRRGPAPL